MKEKDKYRKSKTSDFLRYSGKKMSDKERNSFEKELQKDAFSEEAAEGFAGIDADQAKKDFFNLGRKLNARTIKRQGMMYYRIAASVAVLMIISSVYIVLDRNKPSSELSRFIEIPFAPEINGQPAPEDVDSDNEDKSQKSEPISDSKSILVPEAEEIRESREPVISEIEISEQKTVTRKSVASETESFVKKEVVATLAEIQAEDSNTTLPASSIIAKDSKAAASFSSKQLSEETIADYTPPLPENTSDSFNIYIENNIRVPQEHLSGQTAFVTLTFRVSETGKIDNIKIISSPGKPYSDEAIRLVKEGPLWKPALQKGENIEDKVTLNITFR